MLPNWTGISTRTARSRAGENNKKKQKTKKKRDEWEQMRRSEMSWSTHVNSHFLIQKNTKRTTYISTFISNIHRLKTPACSDIFSRGNIYRLYHKINLYCLFHADGWLGGAVGAHHPVSQSIGPSRQRTACGNAPAHSKKAPPEDKTLAWSKKKSIKILISSICLPGVKSNLP